MGKQYRQSYPTVVHSTLGERIFEFARNRLRLNRNNDRNKDIWALRDINFEIDRGSIVGTIGRNGAGKSTLLKILAGITTPSSGHVDLYGRVSSVLEVGAGFHPELTGRENIFLNGSILGMRRKQVRSRIDEIIAFSEIEKFIDTRVKFYSSGMYVRLAFAVAMFFETDIVLIDEVLSVADVAFQRKCLDKLKETTVHGGTVLLVSHNIGIISRVCDQCLLLDEGRLLDSGPTAAVLQTYVTTGLFQQPDWHAERDDLWKDAAFQAAHKLGNPIFALETALQVIKRHIKQKPDEALSVAQEMAVSIEKAKLIIDQFKSLSRAQENSPRPISVVPLLESSARIARDNGVAVQIHAPERPPRVFVDPVRLSECFDELFANSLHWLNRDNKSIQILVDIPRKDDFPRDLNSKSVYVRISFVDNGCGVPSDRKQQIFEPFYTTNPHGTGLGLSLVQRVISWHGGVIRENGNEGEGACFQIFLPQAGFREEDKENA